MQIHDATHSSSYKSAVGLDQHRIGSLATKILQSHCRLHSCIGRGTLVWREPDPNAAPRSAWILLLKEVRSVLVVTTETGLVNHPGYQPLAHQAAFISPAFIPV